MTVPPFKYHERAEHYERMYGVIDYTDKLVLDIGADWGSTPHFFITKGAKSVIAVEGSKGYYDLMVENLKDEPKVFPLYLYIKSADDFTNLIGQYKPDIVKIDCEGCEHTLAAVKIGVLRIPAEYIMETHGDDILDDISATMTNAGFMLKSEYPRGYGNTGVQYYVRV